VAHRVGVVIREGHRGGCLLKRSMDGKGSVCKDPATTAPPGASPPSRFLSRSLSRSLFIFSPLSPLPRKPHSRMPAFQVFGRPQSPPHTRAGALGRWRHGQGAGFAAGVKRRSHDAAPEQRTLPSTCRALPTQCFTCNRTLISTAEPCSYFWTATNFIYEPCNRIEVESDVRGSR
jgi:hypothetical protein